jgi:hypothetical protein
MSIDSTYLDFPFGLAPDGSVAAVGCGARDLVFAGNNAVLAAATEFKVAKALQTYMGNQVLINGVDVVNDEEKLIITIVYTKTKDTQQQQAVFELLPSEVLSGA